MYLISAFFTSVITLGITESHLPASFVCMTQAWKNSRRGLHLFQRVYSGTFHQYTNLENVSTSLYLATVFTLNSITAWKQPHWLYSANAVKTLPTIRGLNRFSFLNLCIFTLPSIFSWELLLNYFSFIKHKVQTVADHLYYREENRHRAAVHKNCHCICWESLQKEIMKTQW